MDKSACKLNSLISLSSDSSDGIIESKTFTSFFKFSCSDFLFSYWIEKDEIIELSISKNEAIFNKKKNILKINKGEISLKISSKPIKSKIKSKKSIKKINIKDNQKRLKESINPSKKHWKIISNFAKLTFVPESKLSRTKGAGGGDDND